jgi:5-methylcytosine-specific restriction endonuclease McrA
VHCSDLPGAGFRPSKLLGVCRVYAMSSALLRPCASPCCPELVVSGRCATHAREVEARRGTPASRGYDARWRAFTERFRRMLIAAGVAPVCGARLPGAPTTRDSQCANDGRVVGDGAGGQRLHTDHITRHRGTPAAMWDPLNLQLLCRADHSAKTMRESVRGGA